MLKVLIWTLTSLLTAARAEDAFWQAKPKYYERIQAREILLTVNGESHHLKIVGGGQVRASCDAVFRQTARAPELLKSSSYASDVKFNPATHRLTAGFKAYGRSADVELELRPHADAVPKTLDLKMITGPMKGFDGTLTFFPKGEKCDIGFSGNYSYDRFLLPKMFLEFGLEVVLQKLAWSSRDAVESALKGGS